MQIFEVPVSGGTIAFTVNDPQYLHGGPQYTFNDSIAPVFIDIFSFFFVFILTSIAFLRERSQGTIERVMASPMTRSELVMGYISGFILAANDHAERSDDAQANSLKPSLQSSFD